MLAHAIMQGRHNSAVSAPGTAEEGACRDLTVRRNCFRSWFALACYPVPLMPDFCIAVDLGGTNLRIAAVGTNGKILEKISLSTKVGSGPSQVIDAMCDAILRLSRQCGNGGALIGAGIGIPGIIDLEAGVVRRSANLLDWAEFPVRHEIEMRLGTRIFLENDAKVHALGEQWMGAGHGVSNMAMITLGTGIGGAIVLDGKIFHGLNGMAGEFGHVTVEPEGIPCGCGNRGCAERYASATALVRMAREAIATGEAPELTKAASSEAEFSAKLIYDLALQGDEPARCIFRRFGRALGIMLADIINVLNLDMYVIGGGVASAWDAFAPSMFQEVRERSTIYAATAPPNELQEGENRRSKRGETIITRAVLGSDAGLYGAAKLAMG
jgi:glucokinase